MERKKILTYLPILKKMAKNVIVLISGRAKSIYAKSTFKGKWTDAIKQATKELKKEKKI